MPNVSNWKGENFKGVKECIKNKYKIGNRELSQVINIIKNVPVFSVKIGLEIKKGSLAERELITYYHAVKACKKKNKKKPLAVV